MKYILDASVAVRWFAAAEEDLTGAVLDRLLAEPAQFAVPELFFYEVFSVLARTHPDYGTVYADGLLPLVESGPLRYPMTASIATRAAAIVDRGLSRSSRA